MRNAAAERPKVRFRGEGYRLIPSRFPPVAVYRDLVSPELNAALVEIENLTNPRLRAQGRLVARPEGPKLNAAMLQNWNLAPFTYENPEGSLFFRPFVPPRQEDGEVRRASRYCMQLADAPQTALAVSVERRSQFLMRTKEFATGLEMRLLKHRVDGEFLDMRDVPISLSQEERWQIGDDVPPGIDGILFHPPERPSATAIAVLRPEILGSSVQATHYRYLWDGSRIVKLYAFDDKGTEIFPEGLAGPADVLAA